MLQDKDHQAAFATLVTDLRPRLYRFCARMAGSAVEGEDILQEALLKAMQAFPGPGALGQPEAWLFRIARNAALDHLRRRLRAQSMLVPQDDEILADPVDAIDQRQIASLGLGAFMALSPAERGCVILMDVLGYSLREIAQIMETGVQAVKASLHRGRQKLRAGIAEPDGSPDIEPPALNQRERDRLAFYVDRFNARDFDAIRDLLAEDVRLDMVARTRFDGKGATSRYFGNYAGLADWRMVLGLADDRPAVLLERAGKLTNFILVTWSDGKISAIRDFFHCQEAIEAADMRALPDPVPDA